jgi:putative inorganic carbon (hco3(-)) transporter
VLVDHYLKTVAIFWLLSEVVRSPERLRQAAWSLTWMAVGLGLFVVYNYATGATFGAVHERVMGNEGALTKNPNDLALMINLITPLTVALFLGERRALKRHLLAAAIGMEMGTVVLTYSRGGAVTLGVIVLLYLWKLRRRPERPWLIGLIVAAVLALPLVPSSYFDRLGTITDVDSDPTGSSQERWSDMVTAAKTILANPVIGAGIGMNTVAMREARGGGWAPVHNVYLEHALDLGLPGLALFGYLLAACIKAAVSAQRWSERRGRADVRLIAEALQVSLLAYATAAMFHPVSYHPYFYYMAGLAVATWRMGAGARAEAAP